MRRLAVVAAVALGAAVTIVASALPTSALPATLTFEGHGWGHGRGLGQYGALGYAIDHGWSSTQILQHFYANTAAGTIANGDIHVRIIEQDGRDLIVRADQPFQVVNGSTVLATVPAGGAARFQRAGAATFNVFTAPASAQSCAGPWTPLGPQTGQPGAAAPSTSPGDDRTKILQLCRANGVRWYRGTLRAVEGDNAIRTVNRVLIEDYLRGVVPRESPASWGTLGGGRGHQALRAQAVAARSYSRSESRYGWAQTCDTIACQVYGGVAIREGTVTTILEHPLTDRAIAETAGQVRTLNGVPARTEFSSSTGGYTAGGTFPAVVDNGDRTGSNPNHRWTTNIPRATIERAFPAIGTLLAIDVPSRNGLGEWGGRVRTVVLRGSAGSATVSGNDLRRILGLKSDWFRVINVFSRFPAVAISPEPGGGYWLASSAGEVFGFNGADFHGDTSRIHLKAPIIDLAAPDSGAGYWLLGRDGGVFSFNVPFFGSTGSLRLNQPVVGMAAHPSGRGYWFVAADGGIFNYGAARFFGSTGSMRLNQPIVGMAPTPSGNGYWLVARDGGIFSFGDARFFGSTGSIRLAQPIVGMAAHHTGNGYWFVARDGGVFNYGAARFLGSQGGRAPSPVVDMARTRDSGGYWLLSADGTTYVFGNARL